MIHAGKIATVICENNHFRVVIDGETAAVVPRTTTSEIHRYKANATDKRTQARLTPEGSDPMPEVKLDAADAAELAEMLQFLSRWLARDPARLGRIAGTVRRPPRLRPRPNCASDLERFVFLLGGSDGEPLFGPDPAGEAPEHGQPAAQGLRAQKEAASPPLIVPHAAQVQDRAGI